MNTLDLKQQILDNAGFTFNIARALYVNRHSKKAFSVQFVQDHAPANLEECIREDRPQNGWHFYFNSAPSDSVKRVLEEALG